MANKSISQRIEDTVNATVADVWERIALKNAIHTFVSNGNGSTRGALLEIAQNVDWCLNESAFKTIARNVLRLHKGEKYVYLNFKNKLNASSNNIISRLCAEGYISKKVVKEVNDIIDPSTTIVLIDDFIGTGNTILGATSNFPQNKFIIIYHSISNFAFDQLRLKGHTLMSDYTIKLLDFKQKKISLHAVNLIMDIANHCLNKNYSFGYGGLGLMVTYEGTVPNNCISPLWYSKFEIPYNDFIPLFNRNINYLKLDDIRKEMVSVQKNLKGLSKSIAMATNQVISVKEALVLFIIRTNEYVVDKVLELTGIDTMDELAVVTNRLVHAGIIQKEDLGFSIVCSKVKESLANFIRERTPR